jgi:NAD(P)-dependent dehydrogenase (short-subunit alcohol dehydrogenase family)
MCRECTQLVIMDLKKEDAEQTARELVQAFEDNGHSKGSIQAVGLGVNIADEKSVQDGFKSVVEQFGQLDVRSNDSFSLPLS